MFTYTASGGLSLAGTVLLRTSYSWNASGGVHLRRCGHIWSVTPLIIYTIRFVKGDQAWLRYKAQVGILESIFIKKYKIFGDQATYGVIYFDTVNAAYNDGDLISNADAIALVQAYLLLKAQQASAAACS
jgi:hypothetical protein